MRRTLLGCLLALPVAFAIACAVGSAPASPDPADARQAFARVASVLRHPRCLNCHPATDFPRVGDDGHRHAMYVQRGPDGNGAPAMRCSTCHQSANQPLVGVPGAPNWHLAPSSMAWEGLDDQALAKALVDPARNGNRTPEQLFEHMARDPLVGWAWDPGPGRRVPPLSRDEFCRNLRVWLDAGAPAPAKITAAGR